MNRRGHILRSGPQGKQRSQQQVNRHGRIRGLDLRHTLINIVQLNAHSVIGASSCDDDTERRQNVAIVYRGIEQRLGLLMLVRVITHEKVPSHWLIESADQA